MELLIAYFGVIVALVALIGFIAWCNRNKED